MLVCVTAVLGGVALYVLAVVLLNLGSTARSGALVVRQIGKLPQAGKSISVATWNVGYAGLGADMDFVADGGRRYLPQSRGAVLRNLRGIRQVVGNSDEDVFLFQEVARAGPLNWGVDVLDGLRSKLAGFAYVFEPEVLTRFVPPPLRIAHGSSIFSQVNVATAEQLLITSDTERLGGLLSRDYRMLIVRIPIARSKLQWIIVNVHLAAFDDGARIRRSQLADILQFAAHEFEAGNPVVIGGDWNMEFVRDQFAHKTPDEKRFWLHDFPRDALPIGWQLAFDPATPTVRTMHQPYIAGDNYTSVIDGFLVSPNITIESTITAQNAFAFSDHQLVSATFRLREEQVSEAQ